MVVYLLLVAVKPVNNNLHSRSSTEVKLIIATAGVGILTQVGFPLSIAKLNQNQSSSFSPVPVVYPSSPRTIVMRVGYHTSLLE